MRGAVTLALLVVLCVALMFGFGVLFVATPLRALVAKAERIAAGDLSGPRKLSDSGEIRELASAMNTMCERVSEARARVEQEAIARIHAIEQLRHVDRLRTVRELASSIAHQLGTPLNVVRARRTMTARGEVTEQRMRAPTGAFDAQRASACTNRARLVRHASCSSASRTAPARVSYRGAMGVDMVLFASCNAAAWFAYSLLVWLACAALARLDSGTREGG